MILQQLLLGTGPRYLMKAKILRPVPEENNMALLSTSHRLTHQGKGQPPRWSCRTLNPTPMHHWVSKWRNRVLSVPAGQHLGDELYSFPLNGHAAQWSKRQDSTKLTGVTPVCNLSGGFS